jgi:hypothetical protein
LVGVIKNPQIYFFFFLYNFFSFKLVTTQWTITLPDGSQQAGFGEIPADLAILMTKPNVRTIRRWTATLPDGTQRSGEGEVGHKLLKIKVREHP